MSERAIEKTVQYASESAGGGKASRLIQQNMVTLARQEQPPPPAGRPAPRLASRCELSVCLLSLVVPSPLCPPRKKTRQRQDQPKKRIYSSAKIFQRRGPAPADRAPVSPALRRPLSSPSAQKPDRALPQPPHHHCRVPPRRAAGAPPLG